MFSKNSSPFPSVVVVDLLFPFLQLENISSASVIRSDPSPSPPSCRKDVRSSSSLPFPLPFQRRPMPLQPQITPPPPPFPRASQRYFKIRRAPYLFPLFFFPLNLWWHDPPLYEPRNIQHSPFHFFLLFRHTYQVGK